MKKIVCCLFLSMLIAFGINAQERGDWYVGTGDIANEAWTNWSLSPTVGYGITDNLMVGLNVSQTDSTADMELDIHARYYMGGYFVYVATNGLSTEGANIGVGRMFTVHKGVYVDPKIVYDTEAKTTNLTLGVGLKF